MFPVIFGRMWATGSKGYLHGQQFTIANILFLVVII